MGERLGVLLIVFFLLVKKMQSIKERVELIESAKKEMNISKIQLEDMRKSLFSRRAKLYNTVQEYVLTLIPKLKWVASTWKNAYDEKRISTEANDEELSAYFKMEHCHSTIRFNIKGLEFLLLQREGGYVIGYIDSYEQVLALCSIGVEVSVNTLVSLKKGYEKKLEELQKDIDLWTLMKLGGVK